MRIFQITEKNSFAFGDMPVPDAKPGEVLLKIRRLGFCGTDLSTWRGVNPLVSYPRIIGHEISGTIVARGSEVPDAIRVGQQATVIPYTSCGQCAACLQGRENACRSNQTLGVQRDGAFCDYLAVPYGKILTNDRLSLNELVLTEPLSVGFHAVRRGRVAEGDTVAILGCGMIGMAALIAAKARRARVIAVDIDDHKLELARKLGADAGINNGAGSLEDKLNELTQGLGPAVVIEAVGSPQTFRQAVEVVAFTGRVVYIGYAKAPVTYESRLFVLKELDIIGSRNAKPEDFTEVVRVLESDKRLAELLISRQVPFGESGSAMDFWSNHPGEITKIVVNMDLDGQGA